MPQKSGTRKTSQSLLSKRPRVRSSASGRSDSSSRSASSNSGRRAGRSKKSSSTSSRKSSNRKSRKTNPDELNERRTRNRTFLAIAVLALVNFYVFAGRSELDRFQLPSISIGNAQNDEIASELKNACSGHPVRIFTGLEHHILSERQLDSEQTLRLALLHMGAKGEEIHRYEAALQSTLDLRLLHGKNAMVRLAQSRDGMILALEIELGDGHLLQACRNENEIHTRNLQQTSRTDVAIIEIELPAHGGLSEAILDAGEQPELATRIANTLAQDIDFMGEARPEDRISLMIEKRYLGHSFHRYGQLLAVHFEGYAGSFRYYFDSDSKSPAFYDSQGKPRKRAWLRSPIAWFAMNPDSQGTWEPRIEFANRRIGALYHRPIGAPVVAISDGTIRSIGKDPEQGLALEYEIDGGKIVRYQHLSRLIGLLKTGEKIHQGQLVALVGHSGQTPQSRLRIEIVDSNGELLDPIMLREQGSKKSPKQGQNLSHDHLKRFQKLMKSRAATLLRSRTSNH